MRGAIAPAQLRAMLATRDDTGGGLAGEEAAPVSEVLSEPQQPIESNSPPSRAASAPPRGPAAAGLAMVFRDKKTAEAKLDAALLPRTVDAGKHGG